MSTSSPGAKHEPVDVAALRQFEDKFVSIQSNAARELVEPRRPGPFSTGELVIIATMAEEFPACLREIEKLRAALKEARCWLPLNSTPQARGATCETLFDALVKIDAALENK